jgi:hypothetical protein
MLAALGSVAVGGAAAVSTGAFTSVSAERSVSVSVADDADALLSLEPLGNGFRSIDNNDEIVRFSFPGLIERTEGRGLGPNSVYEFERNSNNTDTGSRGLLEVTNRGTQPVILTTEANLDGVDVELYKINDSDKEALSERQPKLGVSNEPLGLGFRVYTFDEVGTFEGSLTITATAAD